MAGVTPEKENLIKIDSVDGGHSEPEPKNDEDYPKVHSRFSHSPATMEVCPPTTLGNTPDGADNSSQEALQNPNGSSPQHDWQLSSLRSYFTPHNAVVTKGLGVLMCYIWITIVTLVITYFTAGYWIWHISYYDVTIITWVGTIIPLIGLFFTIYVCRKRHSTALIVFSGILVFIASFFIGSYTYYSYIYTQSRICYTVGVLAAVIHILFVYTNQSQVKFTTFRAHMLCTFLLDCICGVMLVNSGYPSDKVAIITIVAVLIAFYLVYDIKSHFEGTPQYSLLTLMANQCPNTVKITVDEREDHTSILSHEDEGMVNAHSFLKTNLQIQNGCNTWTVGDEKDTKPAENKVVVGDLNNDETMFEQSTRKAQILKAFTILVYQLLIIKYIFGFFLFDREVSRFIRNYIDPPRSLVQTILIPSIPMFIAVVFKCYYKKIRPCPRLWLFTMVFLTSSAAIYIAVLATIVYFLEMPFMMVAMAFLMCLTVKRYISSTEEFGTFKAFFVAFYTIQGGLIIAALVSTRSFQTDYAVGSAFITLIFSVYLIYDTSSVLQGKKHCSFIRFVNGLFKKKLPAVVDSMAQEIKIEHK